MRHSCFPQNLNKQRGNTLVIAVFVIVVLGSLVAALASLLKTTSESVVVEVLGTRSFLAAQSGLAQAMVEAYPLTADGDDPITVTDCDLINERAGFSAGDFQGGLQQCSATISCNGPESIDHADDSFIHLRITATGRCEAGSQEASRVLSIETRVEEP
jgi:MSHA biogenesis protein MshP